jgi:hypothetical protein
MRKVAGAVLLLIAARLVDAAEAPSLADCASRLQDDDDDVSVAEVCPDIAAAIASGPFAGIALPDEDPTKADIETLHTLISTFGEPRGVGSLDGGRLDGILAGLGTEDKPKSLWQLFEEWRRERWREFIDWLPDIPNPLAGLTSNWPDWARELMRSLGWGLVGMLVATAGIGAIALLRGGTRRMQLLAMRQRSSASQMPALSDLQREPPARRVRLLLQIVIGELRRTGRLVERAALTHRELAGAATGLNEAERRALGDVSKLAERVTYSRYEPARAAVDAAVEQGRMLVGEPQ